MARHVVKREEVQAETGDKPPMEGGTPGIIEGAETHITMPGQVSGSAIRVDSADRDKLVPPERRYEVVGGGVRDPASGQPTVMYDGHRVLMRIGKVVSDNCYDIKKLVDQGIQLRPLNPPEQDQQLEAQAG